jgi:glycosyltransferase involved in cell wall biosynthesis
MKNIWRYIISLFDRAAVKAEDISIVMAVYNHEATVAQAIESALMQEMPYTSVIYCLNDASTDGSAEILKKYSEQYPNRVKVYTSPKNLGSGKKSFLFHKPPVKGRYWCLLAGDDYWTDKSKLSKQISFLDKNKEYVGACCDSLIKDEVDGKDSFIRADKRAWNIYDLILLKNKYAFYAHTTSIIWRNVYRSKDTFLPPNFKKDFAKGDVILAHMMLAGGGMMYSFPHVMSCYRVTGRGVWTSLSKDEQLRLTDELSGNLKKATPLIVSFFVSLRHLRDKNKFFKKIIPGAVND